MNYYNQNIIRIFALARFIKLCYTKQIYQLQKVYSYNKPRLVSLFALAFFVGLATTKRGVFNSINMCKMRDQHNLDKVNNSSFIQADNSRKELINNYFKQHEVLQLVNFLNDLK